MSRRFALLIFVALFALGAGGFAVAQDQATPTAGGTPMAETLCATPLAEANGTPVKVVEAASPAASPGGMDAGTPVGMFPCATPIAATPSP